MTRVTRELLCRVSFVPKMELRSSFLDGKHLLKKNLFIFVLATASVSEDSS